MWNFCLPIQHRQCYLYTNWSFACEYVARGHDSLSRGCRARHTRRGLQVCVSSGRNPTIVREGVSMRFRNRLISSAVAAALGTTGSIVALAQTGAQSPQSQAAGPTQAAQPAQLEEVVVTGIKASLENAQELKKNSDTIQDSIIAEDLGKLPDVTAVEALQRITGVQIGRDLGEGGGSVTIGGSSVNSGIEIRGLPQVETTLNGREVFSASGSRVLNFEDIPSSLLAGIDVYKDPTADLLEGGIGGTVA